MQITIPVRTLVILVVGIAVAVGVWVLVDWLVVTDKERIQTVLDRTQAQAQARDTDRLVDENLDADFRLGSLDREGFRQWVKEALRRFEVKKVQSYDTKIQIKDGTATALVRTIVETESIAGDQRVDWEAELLRHPEHDWRIRMVRAYVFIGAERVEVTGNILRSLD